MEEESLINPVGAVHQDVSRLALTLPWVEEERHRD